MVKGERKKKEKRVKMIPKEKKKKGGALKITKGRQREMVKGERKKEEERGRRM